jgi:hypothetical protein
MERTVLEWLEWLVCLEPRSAVIVRWLAPPSFFSRSAAEETRTSSIFQPRELPFEAVLLNETKSPKHLLIQYIWTR